MAMTTCSDCGQSISTEATACPKCGRPRGSDPVTATQKSSVGLLMVAIPVLGSMLVVLWVGSMNLFQSPESSLGLIVVAVILGTATLAAVEAGRLGMGSKDASDGKRDSGPAAWFFAHILLWVAAFPLYLRRRGKYGQQSLALAGVITALGFLFASAWMNGQISNQRAAVQRAVNDSQRELSRIQKEANENLQRSLRALQEQNPE